MADPFNPGHLFYMADPSNPADHFFYQGPGLVNAVPHPPHPVTNFSGAPGVDADDEEPNASDEQQEYSPWAAPSVPAVGRRDNDHELERRKKHTPPVRSQENWLSHALMIAQSAASTSSVSPDRTRGRTDTSGGGPQQHPYPANPYDPVTPGPHPSCPLCGTPYQRGASGLGPPHVPGPRDLYRHEQTRDVPHLGRCPACHRPTRTQVSPTGAPTRFLSSGRREYISGYTSHSQQYLGGTTTTTPYANTNRTTLPYGSPASSYSDVTRTYSSSRGYQTDTSRITGRTPRVTMTPTSTTPTATMTRHTVAMTPAVTMTPTVTTRTATMARSVTMAPTMTRTETRNHESGSQMVRSTGHLPAANRKFRHNAVNFAPASIGEGRGPAPVSEQLATSTTPPVASTPLSSASVAVTSSQEGQGDGVDAVYSGSTDDALVSDMMTKGFIKSDDVAVVRDRLEESRSLPC